MKKSSILMLIFSVITISLTSAFAQTNGKKQIPAATSQQKTAESLIEGTEITVKVVAVKDNAVSSDETSKPDDGNKYVSIQVVIENKGEDEWKIEPSKFRLKDEEGNIYAPGEFVVDVITKPELKAGIIDGNDFVKGWIAIQVVKSTNVKSLKFRYEDSSMITGASVKSGWIPLSVVSK